MASFASSSKALAYHEDSLAVTIAGRVGVGDVSGEGDVAGHFLPEIAEFVARVPDVVARRVDGVFAGSRVKTGAAGDDRATNVRLAGKDADGGIEVCAGAVEVGRRRHLSMGGRAGLRPGRRGRCLDGALRVQKRYCDAEGKQCGLNGAEDGRCLHLVAKILNGRERYEF